MKLNRTLFRRIGFGVLAIAMIAAIALVMTRTGPLAATRVTVVTVQDGRINPSIFGIGTVEARRNWMVGPVVAGRVLSVRVDVGDQVKAGDLLAEMDPVDFDARLSALDAALERARSTQLAAQAQLADAVAKRELAAINAKRNTDLAAQNFISPGALESRLQEKISADAAVQAAQANVSGSGQDLARQKAERAALQQQRTSLRLLAPADAVVATRDAEAGSTVVAGQPVVRMLDPRSLWIKLRVDQGRSEGLQPGLKAKIVLRSQPQQPLAGKVARVEILADAITEERIAQVVFETPAPRGLATPSVGELAEVELLLAETAAAPVVPNAAIQRQQGQVGVWRIEGGKPVFVPVRLGASSLGGLVQVHSGITTGDSVVVYSHKAVVPGARIEIVEALVKDQANTSKP